MSRTAGGPNGDGQSDLRDNGTESSRSRPCGCSSAVAPGNEHLVRCPLAGTGWTDWKFDGDVCGTTGQQRQMEAIEVQYDR